MGIQNTGEKREQSFKSVDREELIEKGTSEDTPESGREGAWGYLGNSMLKRGTESAKVLRWD